MLIVTAGEMTVTDLFDVRTYAGSALSAGGGVSGAAGGRIGGEVEVSSDTLRLLEAWSRPPGGVWEERVDCTGA